MAGDVVRLAPKRVIKGKVRNWDHRIFIVQKVADSEQEIVVQFSHGVEYQIVKLSISGLPPKDTAGKRIHWLNNFAVVDSRGHHVKRVRYTVFLPAPRKPMTYVYYDQRGLRKGKAPKARGSKPAQPGMVQVDFTTGDPAIGCK